MHLPAFSQNEENFSLCISPSPAKFSEGEQHSLSLFIARNFNQPESVPDSTFCRKGLVQFTINEQGIINECKIIDTLGYGCDEEIIRILKLTKWKPASKEGVLTTQTERLPYRLFFEQSESFTNLNISPQSESSCLPQTPLERYE